MAARVELTLFEGRLLAELETIKRLLVASLTTLVRKGTQLPPNRVRELCDHVRVGAMGLRQPPPSIERLPD